MKHLIIALSLCFGGCLYAQVNEDFSDGNFTTAPVWTGSNNAADFTTIDNKLRSNSNIANTSFYLSTANSLANNTQWEFWINLQFSTSGSNYSDIYVISDKADLKSTLINGYFIRIGNTDDEISFYRRSGTVATSVKIIDGVNGAVGSTNNTIKIRLKRDNIGNFTLEREVLVNNSTYFTEGTVNDLIHTTSTHFGISIQQSTVSFFYKHFLDNIKIASIITDTIRPIVSTVSNVDSNTLAITFSEEMDTVSTKNSLNYSVNNNAGAIFKVLTTNDPAKFQLKLVNALSSGTYILTVTNVKDKNGNLITNNNARVFTYIKPYKAKFGDLVINEIFADPTPQIDLPSVEFAELRNNTDHSISLKNWKFSDSGSSATFGELTIEPGSLLIICAKADTAEFKSYGKVLGLSPWPSLNNSGELIKLTSPENISVDSIRYSDTWYRNSVKKQGGWTIERKDPGLKCHGSLNWFASNDITGGTPGKENSIYVPGYDVLPLVGDSIKQLSDTTIKIYFNKHLNSSTILAQNFALNPNASTVKKIISDFDFKELEITFNQKFLADTKYLLTIENLKDCHGILISKGKEEISFKTSKLPIIVNKADTASLIITEIFADPSPEIGLPLVEFVEVYNPSKDTVDLDKWTINDPTTKATIRNQRILPREYIILCPVADTTHYKSYGKTIGIHPWPSLNNSSDQVVLKSFKNRVVDSIAYSDTWYRSSLKKPGGWSIEKIDLTSACKGLFNWTASIDTNGGTPGKANSVNVVGYDLLSLKADSLKILTDTTIKVYFNKHLDAATLLAENFSLNPAHSVKRIISDILSREVTLTFDKKLQSGGEFKLYVSRLKDCSGNVINAAHLLKFKTRQPLPIVPERIDTSRIVITEIFADPYPEIGLPLVEFIEVYNPGSNSADLDKWTLGDAGTKATITNLTIKPGEYLILCPIADTLLFKQFGKIKGISPWPSLGNAGDQITLKSFKQRLVDSVAFSDKWYKSQKKKNGGWSLEKIDLLFNSCTGFYNWASAIDPIGGTPGRPNSLNKPGSSQRNIVIETIEYTSDSTVILTLNSVADTFYLKPAHFIINNKIGEANAMLVDESYLKIHLEFDSKFKEGINYTLIANSLFNCNGKRTQEPNNQASFTIPIIPEVDYPVVINEIFADPSPQLGLPEVEFVELYNPTGKLVSLQGMSYGDESYQYKFTSGEIAAQSYLILCPKKEISSFSTFGNVLGLPDWPSLGNEKDVVILKNNKGREFQRVAYTAGWYGDSEKKSGGYSLEMVSHLSICTGLQNWLASKDPIGGTPGKQNSVSNLPKDPLKLIKVVLTDSITLLLTFNKTIDSLSASALDNYHINNGIGTPENAFPLSPAFYKVELKLKKALTSGHFNKIEVKEVRDCMGSHIAKEFNYGEFIMTEKIVKNSVLISEILFNPRPGGEDFIEVYNNTNHTLDLQEISIAAIVKDTIGMRRPISLKQLLFEPGQYMSFTNAPETIKKSYRIENPDRVLKATLPQFNDDEGRVVLLSKGVRIDELTYTEKMHFQLLKDFEGVSLERSSFKLRSNEAGNFRSATAASGFATPGYKNSQHTEHHFNDDEFSLISKTFSPDNDGFEDLLQVSYRMPAPGMVANAKIFNDKGILIKHLIKNSTLNAEGLFVWDGLNEFNNTAGSGIYFIFAEIFDISGNVKQFRRSFALAEKF